MIDVQQKIDLMTGVQREAHPCTISSSALNDLAYNAEIARFFFNALCDHLPGARLNGKLKAWEGAAKAAATLFAHDGAIHRTGIYRP